jgi:hypothetical protein
MIAIAMVPTARPLQTVSTLHFGWRGIDLHSCDRTWLDGEKLKGVGMSNNVHLGLAIATCDAVFAFYLAPLEVEKRPNRLEETEDVGEDRVQRGAKLDESVYRIKQ